MASFKRFDGERGQAVEAEDKVSCLFCGRQSDRETLSKYGARCGKCYAEWLGSTPAQATALTIAEKRAIAEKMSGIGRTPAKAWAHVLRAREEAGDPLSRLQKRMWREALGEDSETKGNNK